MRSIYDKCAGRVSHYRDGQIKSLYRLPLTFIMHYTPPIRINNWPGPGELRAAHGRAARCWLLAAHKGLSLPFTSTSASSISPRLLVSWHSTATWVTVLHAGSRLPSPSLFLIGQASGGSTFSGQKHSNHQELTKYYYVSAINPLHLARYNGPVIYSLSWWSYSISDMSTSLAAATGPR